MGEWIIAVAAGLGGALLVGGGMGLWLGWPRGWVRYALSGLAIGLSASALWLSLRGQ
jgi:hypothetical protein